MINWGEGIKTWNNKMGSSGDFLKILPWLKSLHLASSPSHFQDWATWPCTVRLGIQLLPVIAGIVHLPVFAQLKGQLLPLEDPDPTYGGFVALAEQTTGHNSPFLVLLSAGTYHQWDCRTWRPWWAHHYICDRLFRWDDFHGQNAPRTKRWRGPQHC